MPRGPFSSVSGARLGPDARRWLNRIGALLGAAGVVFVALRLASYADEIDAAAIGIGGYLALFGLAAIYGASNLLLALGWWRLLRRLGVAATRGWALRAYAISQLAKYVPGNIFQFAGRQAIGVAAGFSNRPLAKSTALEIFLLVAGGALFLPLTAPLLHDSTSVIAAGTAAFLVLSVLAIWLAARLGGTEFGRAALCYLGFLAISGLIFAGTYHVVSDSSAMSAISWLAGAYVLAWLAGMLTPGAPAGIGVREAVLLFLLADLASPPVILLAVVAGRAVTVLGDLGFYLAGGFIEDHFDHIC